MEYYSRIERGDIAGASGAVLSSLARALQLDEAEHEHLIDLARAANDSPLSARRSRPKHWTARPSLQVALDAITGGPAFVRNGRMDILAANALGRAFYDWVLDSPASGNLARFTFLDTRSHDFYPNWAAAADVCVAILQTEAGRDPRDKRLHDLIGERSTRSEEFRFRWGAHNVRRHASGTKRFHHHEVGDLTLSCEGLELLAEAGLSLMIYTAEPGSPSEERLKLLASWAASQPRLAPFRNGSSA